MVLGISFADPREVNLQTISPSCAMQEGITGCAGDPLLGKPDAISPSSAMQEGITFGDPF
jgi:hypothetical protein